MLTKSRHGQTAPTRRKLRPFDRVIFHQLDPCHPVPGGIDTVVRGILRYGINGQRIGVIGVDTTGAHEIGVWTEHDLGGGTFHFMPVARLDPADQSRKIPHSLRLTLGALRFRSRIPKATHVDAHRADTAIAASYISGSSLTYFIHTQQAGLTSRTSDSFWRRASGIHRSLEKSAVARAERVAVFNPAYADAVRAHNPNTVSMSTWYDPAVIHPSEQRRSKSVVWVGRLEQPKDPLIAIEAIRRANAATQEPWHLDIIGSGTLLGEVEEAARNIDEVTVHGRLLPSDVATIVGSSELFLMTSHPGYEGFPAVLVEAMAAGTIPIVTEGSDTAGLVKQGVTGCVTEHDAESISSAFDVARLVPMRSAMERVADLAAPKVISKIYSEHSQ